MGMPIKRKLREGKSVVGTMLCMITNPNIIWLLKDAGFDFIFIDCEHGTFTFSQVSGLASMCRALDMGVIVRIPQPDRDNVQKYSDMGIDGIMLPMVETVEQVAAAAHYARYTPQGNRGMGGGAVIDYKRNVNLSEVIAQVNEDYLLVAQIETKKGVENIDKILSVPGVDAVFFGVTDLSISYGKPGQIYDPIFRERIGYVLDCAKKYNKICGHHFFGWEDVQWGLDYGVRLVTWHTDTSILQRIYSEDITKITSSPNFIR